MEPGGERGVTGDREAEDLSHKAYAGSYPPPAAATFLSLDLCSQMY